MTLEFIKAVQDDIARLLMALAFAMLFAGGSYYYYISIHEERDQAEKSLNKIKNKYNNAVEDKKTVEEFKVRYEKLKALGVTGTENRLNWVDLIETTARNQGIPYVKYTIDKQEKITDRNLKFSYSAIDVYQSKMLLEMNLLHEGDVYTMIQALDKKALGIFDINNCQIKRIKINKASVLDNNTSRNFSASCVLHWYTMKPKGV